MDYKLILGLLALIVVGFFGYQWFTRKTVEKMNTSVPAQVPAQVPVPVPVPVPEPEPEQRPAAASTQEGPAQFGETLRHPEHSYRQMSEGPPQQFAAPVPETSSGELEPQSMFAYDEYAPSSGVPF